jgi:hypothetical protein
LLWFDIHRSRPADLRGTLTDQRDTDARAERSDAALVAQYIHELSERHGGSDDSGALEPGGEGPDD